MHAEQHALAQIFSLLRKLNISTENKRIVICIDDEATFNAVHNDDETPTYPNLVSFIRKNIYFTEIKKSQIPLGRVYPRE